MILPLLQYISYPGMSSSLQAKRLIKIFNAAEDAGIIFE
jgi:hypothetical protein